MHPPNFDGCFVAHKIGSRHRNLKNDRFLVEIKMWVDSDPYQILKNYK